jgi:hypothetical protein
MGQSLLALSKMSKDPLTRQIFDGLYYVLPDLAKLTQIRFDLISSVYHYPLNTIWLIVFYICAYIVILLSLSTLITEQREFQ